MRYQEHIKILQKEYFEKFAKVKSENPTLTGKDIWQKLESTYDFNMYASYDCFRTSLYQYNKKRKECQKK